MKSVRLQKFIADCGVTSRRKAEELILQKRVQVNGEIIALLGTKINPEIDAVTVDGSPCCPGDIKKIYLVMNKPRGVVTTVYDPEGRPTVMDYCREIPERIYPVGRLDYLSEGLLILTNDGEVAQQIIHPSSGVIKVYEVKVFGSVTEAILKQLRSGVVIEGQKIRPKSVRVIGQLPTKTWLEFRLAEGKNREIRKLCEAHGVTIDKLRRVAIGSLTIDGVRSGGVRSISKKQLMNLITSDSNQEFFSTKRSINLKLKRPQASTPANDEAFVKFRRETYFDSLAKIKETKQSALERQKREAWEEKEKQHQKRVQKKKNRLAQKSENTKSVHARFVND